MPVGAGAIGTYDTTADPSGAFTTKLRAPTLEQFKATPPRFQLSITANDQSLMGPEGPIGPLENTFAAATATITAWDVDVPAWDTNVAKARVGQQRADPDQAPEQIRKVVRPLTRRPLRVRPRICTSALPLG